MLHKKEKQSAKKIFRTFIMKKFRKNIYIQFSAKIKSFKKYTSKKQI